MRGRLVKYFSDGAAFLEEGTPRRRVQEKCRRGPAGIGLTLRVKGRRTGIIIATEGVVAVAEAEILVRSVLVRMQLILPGRMVP